ncbi:MAG: 2-oxoacid:acceptor oxidoreductase subunit alpha [Sedimentisphaerales bacterium]|nr:2-oxoacid:acceptor oxidoreductase subunit alpha [Sedimentisphaerales bacterium]
MDLTIRIAGEAGQGVLTTGQLLVGSLAELGLEVLATRSYMSRVRGGLNWYDIRIGDEPLYGPGDKVGVLVALTDEALEVLGEEVASGGMILHNTGSGKGDINIDLEAVAKETADSTLYSNTVAAGAVMALLGYDIGVLEGLLKKQFAKKDEGVVSGNIACARAGGKLVADQVGKLKGPKPTRKGGWVYDGSTAMGLSAAVSGVKFVTAYPMTPSTGVFTFLAGAADEYGIVVEQAEDEIAAVNMVCGATYAGVPGMTMTSGGGFALMAEGLSLAGMMELPIVVMIAQRPGPATGLPTRTGQQDLMFTLYAGHGEFPRAIFTPGSVQQCYDLTRRAMETAHEYQTPVLILTDQFLQDMEHSIDELDSQPRLIDRRIVTDAGEDYVRYAVTDSGVSDRAIPGGEALVVCDSDSHTADGHITEDMDAHVEQQDKRMRKLKGMTAGALLPERFGAEDAETLLLTWGSTLGPGREAVALLNAKGVSAAMLHFGQVWPLAVDKVKEAIGSPKRIISVEGNCTGQLATLLRSVGVLTECELLTNYTGMPFTGAEIAERIQK